MKKYRYLVVVFMATIAFSLMLSSVSWANTKIWTSKSDWLTGIGHNIDFNKVSGDLRIFYDPNQQHYNQTLFIYIPNSALNTLVKMDTVTGRILWTYKINSSYGRNPSRTTVDTRGNVWVGLRDGSNVIAVSAQGKFLAAVNVGRGPRAVTIDKDGNIWAGGYNSSSITKISGKTFKPLFVVRNSNLCTYGATTDSYGNIWTSDRCRGHASKITPSGKYVGYVNTSGAYGIASDRRGYVWVASYEGQKVYQIDSRRMKVIKSYGLGARGRGVAVDGKGKVWVACSTTSRGTHARQVNRVDPFTGRVDTFKNVGLHTVGIAVDSKGLVWANSLYEGYAYVLDSNTGRYLRKHPVCDLKGTMTCLTGNGVRTSGCKCSSARSSQPYTYSDMTGFQLQVVISPSSATWNVVYDARCKVRFSRVSWRSNLPGGTSIQVRARTASSRSALRRAFWSPYRSSSQSLGVSNNRYIELQFLLKTNDSRVTPAVHDATLYFYNLPEICDGIDNDCDGRVDENFPDLGRTCTVGTGICKNTGRRICNAAKNGTTCSVRPHPPQREVCDGLDNNCNGQVDETWFRKGQSCQVGIGACRATGRWICDSRRKKVVCSATAGTPRPEQCDGIDNDCDGRVDENLVKTCSTKCGQGTQTCHNGHWSKCPVRQPTPEICNGKDDDCDGKIDENFPDLGHACTVGLGVCKNAGRRICNAAKTGTTCDAKPLPPQKEICDGLDNNCNGQVDEMWNKKGQSCEVGIGACKAKGQWICNSQKKQVVCSVSPKAPTPEQCDGKDNDCNGKVDDGLFKTCSNQCGQGTQKCENGQWSPCSVRKPSPEKCNGKDDDCDGQVDNGLKRPCSSICGKGTETCVNGHWVFCDAPKPEPEKCDGKDNDCDGKTDEDIPPKRCRGACGSGLAYCKNGGWTGCSGPQPEPEKCDGKDNDCNGLVDDGLTRSCRSACGEGKEVCIGGNWVNCNAPLPQKEICDGKDNNCDGKIDNAKDLCPTGMVCRNSKCQILCNNGECTKGMKCVGGICVSSEDPCKDVHCQKDESCVNGRCIDACYTVTCPEKQVCEKGKCVENNCYRTGCPNGERCVNGQCVEDPCATVSCSKGSFCRNGKCIASCLNVKCQQDERCVDGQCEKDPHKTGSCAGVSCKKGERCKNGQCEKDPCSHVTCPTGRRCLSGVCVHDTCFNIHCPDNGQCVVIDDKAQCITPQNQYPDEKMNAYEYSSDGGTTSPEKKLPSPDTHKTIDKDQTPVDGGSIGSQNAADEDGQNSSGGRYSPSGCNCALSSQIPTSPSLLFLLLLLLFLPRKKR